MSAYYMRRNSLDKIANTISSQKQPKCNNSFLKKIIKDTLDQLKEHKTATVFDTEQIQLIKERYPDVCIAETAAGIFRLSR